VDAVMHDLSSLLNPQADEQIDLLVEGLCLATSAKKIIIKNQYEYNKSKM